jgi:glutathione peroxidase
MRAAILGILAWAGFAGAAMAGPPDAPFKSIDGGTLSIASYAGHPVLVVNTASFCSFTPQYAGLQELYDTYRGKGLVVLAVPSEDFNQEYGTNAEVKQFCELTYGIDMPMTEITQVTGDQAHPFFRWVKSETGFEPGWNFNKILLDGNGAVVATWGSGAKPMSGAITDRIEALLN